ncbi:hypothetical protein BDV18DRAFT_132139 [Aspergillus unguis]
MTESIRSLCAQNGVQLRPEITTISSYTNKLRYNLNPSPMASVAHLSQDQPSFPLALLSLFRVQFALIVLLPLTFYLVHYIRKDYNAFLALGPGGTPSTPSGYLRICILRLVTLRDPLLPPSIPATLHPKTGILNRATLPSRPGHRPTVAGIAPHRQLTQKSSSGMYDALTKEIARLAQHYPKSFYTATSCFEKHSAGVFCRLPSSSSSSAEADPSNHRITCNGEICHSHPSDGSMHLTLHPADIKLVLERGWAQRHPLARDEWWWGKRSVPRGFLMVYAPRDEHELAVVVQIIRAAAWWVSGVEVS